MPQKTEVLIVKNPFYYKELAPEAYERLMESGGKWIPLVFGVVEKVVSKHFLKLCELDWDYIREPDDIAKATYVNYKSIYHTGLDCEQEKFVCSVADEIEEELKCAAAEALESEQLSDEE